MIIVIHLDVYTPQVSLELVAELLVPADRSNTQIVYTYIRPGTIQSCFGHLMSDPTFHASFEDRPLILDHFKWHGLSPDHRLISKRLTQTQ
jgi:hypothetical protein